MSGEVATGVKAEILGTTRALQFGCGILLACYAGLWSVTDGNADVFINESMPIGTLVVLCVLAFRMVRLRPSLVWTPIPWFMIACAAYFGLGPLAYHYGDELTVASCDYYCTISETNLLRTNFLNLVGILLVAFGMHCGVRMFVAERSALAGAWAELCDAQLGRIASFFLGVGAVAKYGLVLPYEFGQLGFVLPGSVSMLQYFTSFAMAVLMVLVHRGNARWRPVLYLLIASEFVTAVLMFSKMSVMIFFVMLLLGRVLITNRLRPILIGTALVAVSFSAVAPLVSHGRTTLSLTTGTHYHAGLEERFDIAWSYATSGGELRAANAPSQFGWARLNYANAQAFAMTAYDLGAPGDSFGLILPSFVPRFLWPDKPIMTLGREFNYLVNGNAQSSSAPGFFAESYWNGGWLFVAGASVFVGLILAVFTSYSMWALSTSNLLFLPIVFAGIKMGFRPDDWFVPTYIGAPVTALVLHFLLRSVGFFVGPADEPDPSPPGALVTP